MGKESERVFRFIKRITNKPIKKAKVIETVTSERWCAPMAMLDHATLSMRKHPKPRFRQRMSLAA